MKPWKRIEPTIFNKVDYADVVVKTFELPDGRVTRRTIFRGDDFCAAGVVALTKDNKVVVGRQFRPGPELVMDEIPGGIVDLGEDTEATARRELLEETGYEPGEMVLLGSFHRDSYVNGIWYYYLATNCQRVSEQALDDDEFISVEEITIDEFIDNAKRGKMTDGLAVFAAYDQLRELQKKKENIT